jgi:hypothetical protein
LLKRAEDGCTATHTDFCQNDSIVGSPRLTNYAMKSLATSLQRLDSESRLRIRIFILKLLVLGWAAAIMAGLRGYPALVLCSIFCLWQGIFAVLAGVFRRDKLGAFYLTAWDESAAFIAIALLARFGADML